MKTQTPTLEYLLFFRDTQLAKRLSPEEMQTLTLERVAWLERLRKQQKIKDGRPLEHDGAVISRKNAGVVASTPFAGSKESITSYLLLEARHLTEALEIAKGCPVLNNDSTIEVRPMAPKE